MLGYGTPIALNYGDTPADGTATTIPRSDHRHGMPAVVGTAFGTPAFVLGTTAAEGAATTVVRSDATLALFDGIVPSIQEFGDTPTPGVAASAARRDHVHGMPTSLAATNIVARVKQVTQSESGGTWFDDHDLVFPVSPYDGWVGYLGLGPHGDMAADFRTRFSYPSGGIVYAGSIGANNDVPSGSGVPNLSVWGTALGDTGSTGVQAFDYQSQVRMVAFSYIGGANGGSVRVQWTTGSGAAANVSLRAGSFLFAIRVT
jgi:hypothetical protein